MPTSDPSPGSVRATARETCPRADRYNDPMTNRYESLTDGIRVTVRPRFSLAQSDPGEGEFVFSYHVRMENLGEQEAQLLFRHWRIHDAGGEDQEVDG